MSSSMINEGDVDRLNDKDKAELRQFLTNEQQRSQIQSQTHHVTQICWKKCIPGTIKGSTLDSSEAACMSNCVDRFMDMNFFTMEHLNKGRN